MAIRIGAVFGPARSVIRSRVCGLLRAVLARVEGRNVVRSDAQMPARLRRSMRLGLRACVCRSAMVRKVNVS